MAQTKITSVQLSDSGVIPGSYTSADITVDSSGRITVASNGAGGSPGGADTQIQYNDGGSFNGDAAFTFDKTIGVVSASNDMLVNGLTVGRGPSNASSAVCFGVEANTGLGGFATNNTCVGYQAGYSLVTTGFNTFIGSQAGFSKDYQFTFGVAIGYQAGYSTTGGGENLAIGQQALYSNVLGRSHLAVGDYALYSMGVGNQEDGCTAVGHSALRYCTGINNAAFGLAAGLNIISGTDNLFLGRSAGADITNGNGNIYIGNSAGVGGSDEDFVIVIGNSVASQGNGTIVIGHPDNNSDAFINASFSVSDAIYKKSFKVYGSIFADSSEGSIGDVLTSAGSGNPAVWAPASGGASLPATQIGYGDGTSIISTTQLTFNEDTGAFEIHGTGTYTYEQPSDIIINAGSVDTGAGYDGANVFIRGGRGDQDNDNYGGAVTLQGGILVDQSISLFPSTIEVEGTALGDINNSGVNIASAYLWQQDLSPDIRPFAGEITIGGTYTINPDNFIGIGSPQFGNIIISAHASNAADQTVNSSIVLSTGTIERLKIHPMGEFEVSGNTGSSGEVLTSSGPGAPPIWVPVTYAAAFKPQVFTFTYEDIDLLAIQTSPITANTLYVAEQTYVEVDGTDLLFFDPGTYRIDIQGQLLSQEDNNLWYTFSTSYGPYLTIDANTSIVNGPNYIEHFTNTGSSDTPWDNNGPSFNDTYIVQCGTEQVITIQLWVFSTFAEGERASGTTTVTVTRLSDDAGPWA